MRFCNRLIIAALLVVVTLGYTKVTFGAVSSEEAAKLGTTLTGVGADMAGNKDGTIPPYTGGLTKPPANYKTGSGVRPDPFAGEKPLFSINAQNMNQYADKLTEGTKALMKMYPTFRIDVYKTHRTTAVPDFVVKNTAKNAIKAKTANGGLSVRDAHAGYPFPIPKDGYEVMWNHLLRYEGRAWESKSISILVDAAGRLNVTGGGIWTEEFPYYDEDPTRSDSQLYWKVKWLYDLPARKAGESGILMDPLDPYEKPRVAYQYLPGQRRVKLAPEIGFDTPSMNTSGNNVYDEEYTFCGSMERYNMQLIGKKEFYVPYNTYKATYQTKKKEELFGPKHFNPDVIRWELHRMWVVDATLKPGKRHIYHKRRYYVDEDCWTIIANENYDARGALFKTDYNYHVQNYDMPAPSTAFYVGYNMMTGCYSGSFWPGDGGYLRSISVRPEKFWTPGTLAGQGLR